MESHYFLFRHCVRSSDLTFEYATTNNVTGKAQVETIEFSDVLRPEVLHAWSVPIDWCTERGLQLIEKTGTWLRNRFWNDLEKQVKEFYIFADDSHRDIDTAYALSRGLQQEQEQQQQTNADGRPKIVVNGIDWIRHGAQLFNFSQWCQVSFTPQQLFETAAVRLETLDRPNYTLDQVLTLLQPYAQENLTAYSTANINVTLSQDESKIVLTGPVDLIKALAELVFYSRAGGEPFTFLPNLSVAEVYALVQYVHWSRSIRKVNNDEAASRGAIHAQSMLQALQEEGRVTIVTGHDTDLDAFATALGVHWNFPEYGSPDFYPTPPLTGIHVAYQADGSLLKLSALYPVYNNGDIWGTDKSAVLREVPLEFNREMPYKSLVKDDTLHIDPPEGMSGLQMLGEWLEQELQQYGGANTCFRSALGMFGTAASSTSSSSSTVGEPNNSAFSMGTLGTVAYFYILPGLFSFFCGYAIGFCQRRRRSTTFHQTNHNDYSPTDAMELELT